MPEICSPIPRKEITEYLTKLRKFIKDKYKNKIKIHVAGSYSRNAKTSKDIDLIFENAPNSKEILNTLLNAGLLIDVLDANTGVNPNRRQVDIRVVNNPEELPFYKLFFSSGERLSRKLRQRAKNKGYKLTEKGLFKNGAKVNGIKTEKAIYDLLNL